MSTARRLWLLAAIPLLITLNAAPVQRTQEARVVETARQMLGGGLHAWLIPGLNGEIRLRKPPLAYWIAAASFQVLGVSEGAGRLPTALLSWGTIAVTFLIAKRLFGELTGVLSAACLLSSYLFFREGRLAETDGPATFFATLAVLLFWMGVDKPGVRLFHAAAAATGLAFFSKQGPGAFPLLFFIGVALFHRRPKVLWRFVASGAPLTLVVIACWWYGLAAWSQGLTQFKSELAEVTEGIDHPAWFYVYFPMILVSTAPWSLIVIGALVAAAKRAKADPALAGLLIWAAADFVPLCFVGNKQEHYLLPLMPPLMILAGWMIDRAMHAEADAKLAQAARVLIGLTIIGSIFAPAAMPIARYVAERRVFGLDIGLAAGIFASCSLCWWIFKQQRFAPAAFSLAATWSMALAALLGIWGPSMDRRDIRVTAAEIRRQFGDGPYVFYGGDTSLPLCFALREVIPRVDDRRPEMLELSKFSHNAGRAVIWQVPQQGPGPNLPPPPYVQVGPVFGSGGQAFRIFQKPLLRDSSIK